MELKSFSGKSVKVTCDDGKVFFGIVNDYFYPDENNLGKESIVVDTISGDIVVFLRKQQKIDKNDFVSPAQMLDGWAFCIRLKN